MERPDAVGRPPKITQQEADYLLARGKYSARLAAARRTLDIAMRFSDEENAFLFPVGHIDNLMGVVSQKESELNEFERSMAADRLKTAVAKQTVAITVQAPLESSLRVTSDERSTDAALPRTTDEDVILYDMTLHSELILLTDDTDDDWQDRALCAQTDPESFYPDKGGSTREAKKVCLSCEVRDECLEYALDNDERFGIWGGLSERERRKLKRQGGKSTSA